MILAKRPRSDAEPRTFGVANETKITKAFEWSYSYQVSLGFRCFIQVPRLRYVPRNCIGPKFWPQWRRILSILPALLCQLWQYRVWAGGKRFTARPPSWITGHWTNANAEGAGKNQSRQSYTCLVSTNCHSQLIWCIRTFNVFEKHFYILALQYSQMLFEFRIQQGTFVSDLEAYSSSPHIPNKSFAFY